MKENSNLKKKIQQESCCQTHSQFHISMWLEQKTTELADVNELVDMTADVESMSRLNVV